jgi:hypothetical protein
VSDSFGVRCSEAVGDCGSDFNSLAPERRASEASAERFAGEQFHHNIRCCSILADIVDGDDIRVRKRCQRFRLAFEAGLCVCGVGKVPWQNFHRNVTVETVVSCQKDLAHPSRANRRDNLERAETAANGKTHSDVANYSARPSGGAPKQDIDSDLQRVSAKRLDRGVNSLAPLN